LNARDVAELLDIYSGGEVVRGLEHRRNKIAWVRSGTTAVSARSTHGNEIRADCFAAGIRL